MIAFLTTRLRKSIAHGRTGDEVYRILRDERYLSDAGLREAAGVVTSVQACIDAWDWTTAPTGAELSRRIEQELSDRGYLNERAETVGAEAVSR